MAGNVVKLEKQLPTTDLRNIAYITIELNEKVPYKSLDASRKQCSPGDMLSSSAWATY